MANTKSIYLLIIAIFTQLTVVIPHASAQRDSFGHVFLFDIMTMDRNRMIREPVYVTVSDTAVYKIFERFAENKQSNLTQSSPKSEMILGVKLNPSLSRYYSAWVQSVSKVYPSFIISDSSDATLIAMGINEHNKNKFIYRVVENDSVEVVSWRDIPSLQKKYGAREAYGFLGVYNKPGKRLMIEVMKKGDYSSRDGIIFDWRVNFTPVVSQITIGVPGNYFNLAYRDLNHGYATQFEQGTGLPLNLRFPADSVLDMTFLFKKSETVVYAVYLTKSINGNTDTAWMGSVDQYGYFQLSNKKFNEAGHYELLVTRQQKQPEFTGDQSLKIPFDVLPSVRLFSARQLWLYVGAAVVLLLILFAVYRRYTLTKIKRSQQQRSSVQLQLKSIRAQLNPHFMFNALSSIQNLMNKNELLKANHFLSTFAKLTRKVLDTSEHEMISLGEEMKIASDYLEMEQLRFGFEYQLDIDPDLNEQNTEIPAMLLQPFIENAVKHGVAGKTNGQISVSAKKEAHDLVLTVKDNGNGFDTSQKNNGSFGLKLSEERINLLNRIHKDRPAVLTVFSERANTIITITLTNWI